jgi:cysteine protease ATG4
LTSLADLGTMATVDFGRYKRIVQYFWDPEPLNDASSTAPIWCLGRKYNVNEDISAITLAKTVTPPNSQPSSVDSKNTYDECGSEEDKGWPAPFLDDFEARIWLTYRSSFPAIPKSQDPKALSSMSLSVRLRSQLVDQGGFTSDTGWGCMIRSGQGLLANSLLTLRMGRGTLVCHQV